MDFDWSTFILEIINFLVLIWLLHRLLYRPVLNIIAERQQKIELELKQAANSQQQAQLLKNQYEQRLGDWEIEKKKLIDDFEQQMDQERHNRLQQLDEEMKQQQLRHQIRDEQLQNQWRKEAETLAINSGAAFTARLLKELSGKEVDERLFQLFIEQFQLLPEQEILNLREGWQERNPKIEIVSAAKLNEQKERKIRQALEQKLGLSHLEWIFKQDEKLIAGIRVSIGGWVLQANLENELHFFTSAALTDG